MAEATGCIEAPRGYRDADGYAQKWYQGRSWRAHRLAWFLAHGPIPQGMVVCHACDNPPCINVDHLFLGSVAANNADMRAKARHAFGDRQGSRLHPESRITGDRHWTRQHPDRIPRGERTGAYTHPERLPRGDRHGSHTKPERLARGEHHGIAKLTDAAVREIRARRATGESFNSLGRAFGVSRPTIADIIHGRRWTHVI